MRSKQWVKKYELPIILQQERIARQVFALPLCAILTNENLIPWYYQNFVELYFTDNHINYVGLDFQFLGYNYDMFLSYRFNIDYRQYKTMVSYLIGKLQEQFYAYLNVDIFYIPHTPNYRKRHFYHDILLYGFDNQKKCFLGVYYDDEGIFNRHDIPYSDLKKAFQHIKDCSEFPKEQYDVTLFNFDNLSVPFRFDLKAFTTSLYNYVNSVDKTADMLFTIHLRRFRHIQYDFGISGIEKLISKFETTHMVEFIKVNFLYEHKKGILSSMKYIASTHLKLPLLNEHIEAYQAIVDTYENIRMLTLKLRMLKQQDMTCEKLFDSILKKLKRVVHEEKRCLTVAYEYFQSVVVQTEENEQQTVLPQADALTDTSFAGFAAAQLGTDWFERSFSFHRSWHLRWPCPQKVGGWRIQSNACMVLTFDDGEQFFYNTTPPDGTNVHTVVLPVPKSVESVQLDLHAHTPIHEGTAPLFLYRPGSSV